MLNKFILILLLMPQLLWAKTLYHVDDIEIDGAVRFSREALLSNISLDKNVLDISDSAQLIKTLHKTNFYSDIQLFTDKEKLIIQVKERPSISKITFKGNKKLEDRQLESILDDANIKKGRTFNRSILSKIETELRKFYVSFGKYGVQIKTKIITLKRNRIALKVKIYEGKVSKIQQINIVGNHVFSDSKLMSLLELGTVSEINPFSSADEYSKAKLSGDIETIRSYYLDRGYLRFSIKSSQVTLSPNKEKVFIAIHLFEGEKYHISDVRLNGDLKLSKETLLKKVSLSSDDVFSRKKMIASSQAIKTRLGDDGYAFAKVNAVPEVDEKSKSVKLTYLINARNKVYVRRINVHGNTKTHDNVFRREFRQFEGAILSPKLLNRSKVRLQRLSYVASVSNEFKKIPGINDQVDIETTVEERPSGSFTIGGGFSNSQGLLFNMSFAQQNMLGTGKSLSITYDNSSINKKLAISTSNPYYTQDGISRTLSLYFKEVDATAITTTADYFSNNTGASISYGIPRSETEVIRLSTSIDQTRISTTSGTPIAINDYLTLKGKTFDEINLSASYVNDSRNKTVFATSGSKHTATIEMTIPGSTVEYFKTSYKLEYNYLLGELTTFVARGNASYGHSYSTDETLPFFKRYYAGGVYSVRGYRSNGLGPKDSIGNALGGDLLTTGTVEVIVPPFEEGLSSALRYSLFADFGTVASSFDTYKTDSLRYSVGLALMWLSPIGPLNFSLSEAMNPDATDSTETLQFYIGGLF